jgi:YjbE family integral membrane protein
LFDIFANGGWLALVQVVLIDIVLAGDNALVIGLAATQVPTHDRNRVIFWGLTIAVALRVVLAVCAVWLLKYTWVMLAGGVLLLWVCWRLYGDIRRHAAQKRQAEKSLDNAAAPHAESTRLPHGRAMRRAVISIAVADLSMSLDNVLAVAGAAIGHIPVLIIGLAFSIALMGLAANIIARILNRYPWVSYVGVAIVFYVALKMIWHFAEREGWFDPAVRMIGA